MSSWSCPYQTGDYFCQRVQKTCEPGMKGCILRGKVHFAKDEVVFPDGDGTEPKGKNVRKGNKTP